MARGMHHRRDALKTTIVQRRLRDRLNFQNISNVWNSARRLTTGGIGIPEFQKNFSQIQRRRTVEPFPRLRQRLSRFHGQVSGPKQTRKNLCVRGTAAPYFQKYFFRLITVVVLDFQLINLIPNTLPTCLFFVWRIPFTSYVCPAAVLTTQVFIL